MGFLAVVLGLASVPPIFWGLREMQIESYRAWFPWYTGVISCVPFFIIAAAVNSIGRRISGTRRDPLIRSLARTYAIPENDIREMLSLSPALPSTTATTSPAP